MTTHVTHRGGCHCGAVRFEIDAPARLVADRCNCSICAMTGFLHVIVPAERFRLLSGGDSLAEYRFNTGVARHLFCSACGVKSFYVPRSHPEGYSVNLNCVDRETVEGAEIHDFDGRNWEDSIAALRARDEE